MNSQRLAYTLAILLALASPALAGGPVRCTTYEEKTMGRLQTVCSDGTRATSYWSPSLQTWQTTVTPPPTQNRYKYGSPPKGQLWGRGR